MEKGLGNMLHARWELPDSGVEGICPDFVRRSIQPQYLIYFHI